MLDLFRLDSRFVYGLGSNYGKMIILALVQIILLPFYLEHFGKARFGVLVLIMAVMNYASLFVGWLSGTMERILNECAPLADDESFGAAYAFAKIGYLAYALAILCVFWLIAPWLLSDALNDKEIFWTIVFSCFYLLLCYEYNSERLALFARKKHAHNNLYEIAGQLVFVIVVLAEIHVGMNLAGVVMAQICGMLVTRFCVCLFWRHAAWRRAWRWPISGWRELCARVNGRQGKGYMLCGVLCVMLTRLDIILLGALAGTEAAADYYMLWRLPEAVILLFWSIPGVYAPWLVEMDVRGQRAQLVENYRKTLMLLCVVACCAALFYACAGRWILQLWVGSQAPREQMSYVIAALALFFLASVRWPFGVAYALMRGIGVLTVISALELFARALLTIIFLERFGYVAPLLAVIATYLLGAGYFYVRLGKQSCALIE